MLHTVWLIYIIESQNPEKILNLCNAETSTVCVLSFLCHSLPRKVMNNVCSLLALGTKSWSISPFFCKIQGHYIKLSLLQISPI